MKPTGGMWIGVLAVVPLTAVLLAGEPAEKPAVPEEKPIAAKETPPPAKESPAAPQPAAAKEATGQVTSVTLYRGQAMVTRAIPVEGGKGPAELIVGNLPEQVVPTSLFAEGSEGVEVRAVRFRSRAVGQEPREEVRRIDEAIEETNEKMADNKRAQETLAKSAAYLDQIETGFVAPAFKSDLARGVLDATALQKVTTFNFEQRKTLSTERGALEKEAKELAKALALLEKKKAEVTGGAANAVREAVVFLEKHADEKETLRLSYLVSNCGWSPAYTIRAGKDRKECSVECSGLIHQMSGEDWSGVTLVLSTASPALAASGPGLAPFPVALAAEGKGGQQKAPQDLGVQVENLRKQKTEAISQQQSAVSITGNLSSSWAVNAAANDFQAIELTAQKDAIRALKIEASPTGEEPSLSYQLPSPVSLASRADQQMVRLLQTSLKSVFYHVATPVLTSYVYREAELTNSGPEDLLAGPITAYLDGRFVGRGEIPTVARGQTFVVGFGGDPQLRTRRELANRSELVQGGNRELNFKYRLIVENYKSEAVPVRVFDRLPYSDRTTDVRIKLGDLKDPLSEDQLYVRTEKPKNILRWDITVPANAAGDKARIIEYGFTVDFDRNFTLNPVGEDQQRQQMEFERLQRSRMAR